MIKEILRLQNLKGSDYNALYSIEGPINTLTKTLAGSKKLFCSSRSRKRLERSGGQF